MKCHTRQTSPLKISALSMVLCISPSSLADGGASVKGDELGNTKALGVNTWARCAPHLANPKANSYELSYLRSNTMPASPFGAPLELSLIPHLTLPTTTIV